jgi:chromosome segregation ATPase
VQESLAGRVRDLERQLEGREIQLQDVRAEMAALVKQAESRAADEFERAERIQKDLAAEVDALQAQLRDREESLGSKNSSMQELEKHLNIKIGDLQNQLREKQAILEEREVQLRNVGSEKDVFAEQMAQMKALVKQVETRATGEAERVQEAERARENFRAELAALQVQLQEKEQHLEAKDSTTRALEEVLSARVQVLENQLQEKRVELEGRERQLAEKTSLLEAHERELEKFRDQVSGEIKKLNSELHEKKLLLAGKEREAWQSHSKRWRLWRQNSGGTST